MILILEVDFSIRDELRIFCTGECARRFVDYNTDLLFSSSDSVDDESNGCRLMVAG